MSDEIETFNKFLVSFGPINTRGIVIMNPPRGHITEEDALNLAAYLVALAGGMDAFAPIYEAVCNV